MMDSHIRVLLYLGAQNTLGCSTAENPEMRSRRGRLDSHTSTSTHTQIERAVSIFLPRCTDGHLMTCPLSNPPRPCRASSPNAISHRVERVPRPASCARLRLLRSVTFCREPSAHSLWSGVCARAFVAIESYFERVTGRGRHAERDENRAGIEVGRGRGRACALPFLGYSRRDGGRSGDPWKWKWRCAVCRRGLDGCSGSVDD
ncbi:hypothetical protein BJ912DRAFT_116396 [Pholiota molesta]|nr:hypothetical protein BJ912DRAFT_116396 [Pholiota molesta]